jgi:hypothetical protein
MEDILEKAFSAMIPSRPFPEALRFLPVAAKVIVNYTYYGFCLL